MMSSWSNGQRYSPISATEEEDLDAEERLNLCDDGEESFSDDAVKSVICIEEDNGDGDGDGVGGEGRKPLQISSSGTPSKSKRECEDNVVGLLDWKDPWFPSVVISLSLAVPVLLGSMLTFYDLTGRMWCVGVFALHLVLVLANACYLLPKQDYTNNSNSASSRRSVCFRIVTSCSCVLDMALFAFVHHLVWKLYTDMFFTDVDDTAVLEWTSYRNTLHIYRFIGSTVVMLRFLTGTAFFLNKAFHMLWLKAIQYVATRPRCGRVSMLFWNCREKYMAITFASTTPNNINTIVGILRTITNACLALALVLFMACFYSTLTFWPSWSAPPSPPNNNNTNNLETSSWCDPLDTTECWLPFPSFHHLRPDTTTATGWRVNLQGPSLPPLKSGHTLHLDFLNHLDGFSTMAPIMFYLPGLQEAHEAPKFNHVRLQSWDNVHQSITANSITFLVDVKENALVAHSAEIDYVDAPHHRPLVLVFPAQPLKHNAHYALAVINATDADGQRLPVTDGMLALDLWNLNHNNNNKHYHHEDKEDGNGRKRGRSFQKEEGQRRLRYQQVVIPALHAALGPLHANNNTNNYASFTLAHDPNALQLLFDFHTVSAESQLGPIHKVRDATLQHVTSSHWGKWKDHVRVIQQIDHDCHPYHTHDNSHSQHSHSHSESDSDSDADSDSTDQGPFIARTIHAELDVPWFLQSYRNKHRGATLDEQVVQAQHPVLTGTAKFVVYIPCSLRSAALQQAQSQSQSQAEAKPLRAIMEYGHGLFYNRQEASSHILQKTAHQEGYAIVAMDWRGMSSFDLPLVLKALLGSPEHGLQAMRDNLIQGYANKFALQLFVTQGLLVEEGEDGGGGLDWFHFSADVEEEETQDDTGDSGKVLYKVPTLDDKPPTFVFYGISQGGILGAGYAILSAGITQPTVPDLDHGTPRPRPLMERAILNVPGTSFTLIMSRSLDFLFYDHLLLRNFYNNRHIRLILTLMQMAWDPLEGAGNATPNYDKYENRNNGGQEEENPSFPPMLLQSGLGDVIVPTSAAEALARGLGASVLPTNPRKHVFGIKVASAAEKQTSKDKDSYDDGKSFDQGGQDKKEHVWKGPHVTLTELLYQNEYGTLPVDNVRPQRNDVHVCVRRDPAMIRQMAEFINTGNVIDPCEKDGCRRSSASCFLPWRNKPKENDEREEHNSSD